MNANFLSVVFALAKREITRFLRQPSRVVGSVAQPILFWVFLGSGFSPSFRAPGMESISYLEYFFPGVLVMLMLFASIFSSITTIEDRDHGFLQGVLVAPVPRLAIVLGKVLGGAGIAIGQGLLLLAATPFLGFAIGPLGLLLVLMAFLLTSIGFTALGFLIAWPMKTTAGFHAIMMVFLMPMWMLSGALFPITTAPDWLWALMIINPVTHSLALLRGPFYTPPAVLFADPHWLTSLVVAVGWAGITLLAAIKRVERVERGAPA